jgi:hypothetical protein
MTHIFEHLAGLAQFGLGLVAAILFGFGTMLMSAPGREMRQRGCSILGFEMAGSSAAHARIQARWGAPGKSAAAKSLWADTLFYVPGYAVLTSVIAAGCAAEVGSRIGSGWADLTRWIAYAALAAGVFDWIENGSLALVLKGNLAVGRIAQGAASVKFLLIIPAVAWVMLVVLPVVAAPGL